MAFSVQSSEPVGGRSPCAMESRPREERDEKGRGTAHDPEKEAEKEALEALFEQAMMAQGQPASAAPPTQAPPESPRVFSFTSTSHEGNSPPGVRPGAIQEENEDAEAPTAPLAFGQAMAQTKAQPKAAKPMPTQSSRTSASSLPWSGAAGTAFRGGSVEDRLKHMEDLMTRCHWALFPIFFGFWVPLDVVANLLVPFSPFFLLWVFKAAKPPPKGTPVIIWFLGHPRPRNADAKAV